LINPTYKTLEQLEAIHFGQQKAIDQIRQWVFRQALQEALKNFE